MSDPNATHPRDIFAIVGLPPEVLAVAMAKYSRSAKSIRETIDELTEEKSAEFHEKWVLGYGDASVADMAIVALALENVSILASKAVEHHRLAAYQEKSTRYQPFDQEREVSLPVSVPLAPDTEGRLGRYYRPASVLNSPLGSLYIETCERLFAIYRKVAAKMADEYRQQYPKPEKLTDKGYAAKVRARSLDVARYCLPVATLTNFGMIINARSLRHAIAVMKGSTLPEVRAIAEEMRLAATSPAYNPQEKKIEPLLKLLKSHEDGGVRDVAETLEASVRLQVRGAPTLVKHTEPKEHLRKTEEHLKRHAERLLKGMTPESGGRVEFLSMPLRPEDEVVATLLYSASHASFRQVLERVRLFSDQEKRSIVVSALEDRTQWDWPTRHFEVPGGFLFDTLMDYGAFRDLQRHRMTTQINQTFTTLHGAEIPYGLGVEEAGVVSLLQQAYEIGEKGYEQLRRDFPEEAAYVIPMGFRKRTLFKMNLRELYHIVELRTKAGGHLSYRDICYEMYEQVKAKHPMLVEHLRAVKPNFPQEFFER